MPHRPAVSGLRFRRWRGFDDLTGMAAANQRARDDLGIEEVIDLEGMTRTYSHLDHCDLATDLVIAERDGADDRLHPRRVAGPDQRRPPVLLVRHPGPGRAAPGHRPGDAELVRGPGSARSRPSAAGRSARSAVRLLARSRPSARGSCSSATAGSRSPAATTWSGPRSTTSRTARCPTGSSSGPWPRPSDGRSGRRRARRSATTATSRSGPRPTGRRSRATTRT